jgi:hypothetical protein
MTWNRFGKLDHLKLYGSYQCMRIFIINLIDRFLLYVRLWVCGGWVRNDLNGRWSNLSFMLRDRIICLGISFILCLILGNHGVVFYGMRNLEFLINDIKYWKVINPSNQQYPNIYENDKHIVTTILLYSNQYMNKMLYSLL